MKYIKFGIEEIQKYISENIRNINNGGCVHFAYYLNRRLNQLNIKNSVILCDRNKKYVVITNYEKFDAVDHVMVYIPKIGYVDGKNIIKKPDYEYYKKTNLELNQLRKDEYPWNHKYCITQNSDLSRIINKFLPYDYKRE